MKPSRLFIPISILFAILAPACASAAPSTGTAHVVVVLANFSDTPAPNMDTAVLKTNIGAVAQFYKDSSYGQLTLNSEVLGPVTLSMKHGCIDLVGTGGPGTVSHGILMNQIISKIGAGKVTPSTVVMVVMPFGTTCGWRGITYDNTFYNGIRMDSTFINTDELGDQNAFAEDVMAHEFGRALGFGGDDAAAFDQCTNVSVGDPSCNTLSYLDLFDVMGGRFAQLNALHKEYLGWFNESSRTTVTQSGRYVLKPIESLDPGVKVLKILRGPSGASLTPGDYIYVEYRQPMHGDEVLDTLQINSDSSLPSNIFNGALLHLEPSPGSSLLINPFPNNDFWHDLLNPVLLPGQTFVDPASGNKITVVSADTSQLTVDVQMVPPQFSLTTPFAGSIVSGTIPVTVSAVDNSAIGRAELYWLAVTNQQHLFSTLTTPPYTASLDTSTLPNGPVTVLAKAYDRAGSLLSIAANSTSNYTQIVVQNAGRMPPGLLVSSPRAGDTVHNPVSFTSSVTGGLVLSSVQYYVDQANTPACKESVSTFTCSTTISNGSHTVYAAGTDKFGNKYSSVSALFSVESLSQTSTLTGTITYAGPSKAVVPGATVSLVNTFGGTPFTTTTDASGTYTITNIPPGTYAVTATKPQLTVDPLNIITTPGPIGKPDAIAELRLSVGLVQSDTFLNKACDVDSSGAIDTLDAILTLRYELGNTDTIGHTGQWVIAPAQNYTNPITLTGGQQTFNLAAVLVGDCKASFGTSP